jgi:hypothetical protein
MHQLAILLVAVSLLNEDSQQSSESLTKIVIEAINNLVLEDFTTNAIISILGPKINQKQHKQLSSIMAKLVKANKIIKVSEGMGRRCAVFRRSNADS